VEIGHLPNGMHTCICAAAAGYFDFLIQDPGKSGFQLALNGISMAVQSLPAQVPGTVIANIQS
jgi:hypothetical protein